MQASAEQPGAAAVASKKSLEAPALTAAAESRQLHGPNAAEVVEVEADNLYTEDSSLLGLRVKVGVVDKTLQFRKAHESKSHPGLLLAMHLMG